MSSTETVQYCSNQSPHSGNIPPISDKPFYFTSDYELRVYTSGCYYFDELVNQWSSEGLLVSRLRAQPFACIEIHSSRSDQRQVMIEVNVFPHI